MKDIGTMVCHCGSRAKLESNSKIYGGKTFGNGMAYICERFPKCRGSVGVHPCGRPLGTIPDEETKKLRMKVHAAVDPNWKSATNGRSKSRNRGSVYGWLRRITGMGAKDCHIGMFSKADCLKALDAIEKNPYLQKETGGVV